MKLSLAALAALIASLSAAARAEEAPAAPPYQRPSVAFELSPKLAAGYSFALEEQGDTLPLSYFGAGLGAGVRLGPIHLGAEAELAHTLSIFTANAGLGSVLGYAGIDLPINDKARFEVRIHGGRHDYFDLSGQLFSDDPRPNHTGLAFAGAEGRIEVRAIRGAHYELSAFGALAMDVDLSTATLNQPGGDWSSATTMKVGGLSIPISVGLTFSFY